MEMCSSCKMPSSGVVTRFMCPSCGKMEILRCEHCKSVGVKYTCKGCKFSGPN